MISAQPSGGCGRLRCAPKTASDPCGLLEQHSDRLHLSPQFKSLLETFAPKTAPSPRRASFRINRFSRRSEWNTLFLPKS